MKKAMFFLPVLLILGGCFFGSSLIFSEKEIDGKANLVPNADFEVGVAPDSIMPDNWMFLSNCDYRECVSWNTVNNHKGRHSLQIVEPKEPVLIISDSFPIDSGVGYYNHCHVRSKLPSKEAVTMYFRAFDVKGNRCNNYGKRIYPGSFWQEIAVSSGFFKPKAQFARVIISIPASPDNTFWIDDIGSYYVHTFSHK